MKSLKTNITEQLKEILQSYTDEVMETVIETMQEVAEDTKQNMKTAGTFENRSGKYRKSWKVSMEKNRTFASVIVHAGKPHYRLTHLLEYGHKKANSNEMTRAFPHITVANVKAQEDVINKIAKAIEKIN